MSTATLISSDPTAFLESFFTGMADSAISGTETETVVDQYHTRDVVEHVDGRVLDRERLVAHLRPVAKSLTDYRIDVHEAIADGGRLAARFTIHASIGARAFSTCVAFFGEFTDDGRLRSSHQFTRDGGDQ